MSNIIKYAERELDLAGYNDGDEMNELMKENILDLIKLFSSQGHSGFSAKFAINLFSILADYRPISQLTGNDDEWIEYSSGEYQNIRCSSVFKNKEKAWRIDGRVFETPDGKRYVGIGSSIDIIFPYTWAKPEIVKVTNKRRKCEKNKTT